MSDLENSDILNVSNGLQKIISNVSSVNYERSNFQSLIPSIKKVESALQQYHEHVNKNAVATIKMLNENNFQNILSLYSQSSLDVIKTVQMNSLSKIINSLSFIQHSNKIDMAQLSKSDFRVDVVTQELEQAFTDKAEEVTENLLFKETSNPVNELDSQLFDILNQQRKILDYSENILKEIDNTQSKNISEEPSNKSHDSPAFYEDKMWYFEQIASNLIGLVVVAIYDATIGVDPSNTLSFALLLGCLLRFIKPKP